MAATAIVALTTGAVGAWLAIRETTVPRRVVHLNATPPGDSLAIGSFDSDVAISPDALRIAYVGGAGGAPPRIYVRELKSSEATELAGTDNARGLFFSCTT